MYNIKLTMKGKELKVYCFDEDDSSFLEGEESMSSPYSQDTSTNSRQDDLLYSISLDIISDVHRYCDREKVHIMEYATPLQVQKILEKIIHNK